MLAENESVTRTNYKIVHTMVERRKPFTARNFIRVMEAENTLCPEKNVLYGTISSSGSVIDTPESYELLVVFTGDK